MRISARRCCVISMCTASQSIMVCPSKIEVYAAIGLLHALGVEPTPAGYKAGFFHRRGGAQLANPKPVNRGVRFCIEFRPSPSRTSASGPPDGRTALRKPRRAVPLMRPHHVLHPRLARYLGSGIDPASGIPIATGPTPRSTSTSSGFMPSAGSSGAATFFQLLQKTARPGSLCNGGRPQRLSTAPSGARDP